MRVATDEDARGNPVPYLRYSLKSGSGYLLRSRVRRRILSVFPVLRSKYQKQVKRLSFNQEPRDQEFREAMARRIQRAIIQPVSAFMKALRFRWSPSARAGGRSARAGSKYINGASHNPALLTVLLNIFRIYYNRFEIRQYTGNTATNFGTASVESGLT